MYKRPNYETARQEAGFGWYVGSSQDALREVTGIPIREFNLEPQACIEAYRKGRRLLREMFGEDVGLPGVSTPAISYGHVNGLGSVLIFPEGGEVGHTHIYRSLDEGIRALRQPVDFARAGMASFYIEFREKMKAAFPGEPVGFSYGLEGPITTAYEMRGDGIFTDVLDSPGLTAKFLGLVVDSILQFHRFHCTVVGVAAVDPKGSGMCDDISSMIPPRMWPQVVLPFWEQYYTGMTTGTRSAHVEDLRPAQLGYLEEIGLRYYDPSISARIDPGIIFGGCRVPFGWRLGSFHYRNMDGQDIRDFVFKAAADGASSVFTYVAHGMCNESTLEKVRAFIRAAKEAERLLQKGASRVELAQLVSGRGRDKFWKTWLR
jgi:hypothetical protein